VSSTIRSEGITLSASQRNSISIKFAEVFRPQIDYILMLVTGNGSLSSVLGLLEENGEDILGTTYRRP